MKLAKQMAVARIAIGGAAYVAPSVTARVFGFPADQDNGSARALGRLFAVRDVALGLLVLGLPEDNPRVAAAVYKLNALVDGGDALTAVTALVRRHGIDRAALATAATASEDIHDRLFDAVMARVEAMEAHRAALISMARGENPVALAAHFQLTARAVLEAAGVTATAPRLAAMTLVWGRIVQVWRDDEGALNRTMAEIDKRLKQMRTRLGRIGAGF